MNTSHPFMQQTVTSELTMLTPILATLGYTLKPEQKHLLGERAVIEALTTVGGRKLILEGHDTKGNSVIIKAAKERGGQAEINHERLCRNKINDLAFAYDVFSVPEERYHGYHGDYLINIQTFIPQEQAFLERSLQSQFQFALDAFKAQEHSRATTSRHLRSIKNTFGIVDAAWYHKTLTSFMPYHVSDTETLALLTQVESIIRDNLTTLEQYGGFLTHTDFVPHNFRISHNRLFLLDFSAIRFGNKHESWARFINFMTLYNPPLAELLSRYIKDNRAPEEAHSLWLMRLLRLSELMTYYRKTLSKSAGDLATLNEARITFWRNILTHVLAYTPIPDNLITDYVRLRDSLRSEDEKKRQIGLH